MVNQRARRSYRGAQHAAGPLDKALGFVLRLAGNLLERPPWRPSPHDRSRGREQAQLSDSLLDPRRNNVRGFFHAVPAGKIHPLLSRAQTICDANSRPIDIDPFEEILFEKAA